MVRITVLAENTACSPALEAEHGLSLLIETDTRKVLFDMGQSDLFLRNAARLGKDLSTVDPAILSHGHYDHGGGLATFLESNKNAPLYAAPSAFEPHFNEKGKFIGLDPSLQNSPRLIRTEEETDLGGGMTLISCNGYPRPHTGTTGMETERNGIRMAEDFSHEQFLVIEKDSRRIVISGCSHKGIENIVEWLRPQVLLGGFHVSKKPLDDKLAALARRLSGFDTDFYTFHCTGKAQYEFMKPFLPRLTYLCGGETLVL